MKLHEDVFKSEEHKNRFMSAIGHIGKVYDGSYDVEYSAALYILTADKWTWSKVSAYVSSSGIDFAGMLEDLDFSGGYSVMILLVGNLFNGQQHIDPLEFLRLDNDNFEIAMTAIKLRRD